MIIVNDLNYAYDRDVPILQGVQLRFEPGKIYGLLGRNGMGKSTLLKLIGGYLFPISGRIRLNDQVPHHRCPQLLQRIFFLSEEFDLPSLTIAQYLTIYSPFYDDFDEDRFHTILREFDIAPRSKVNKLSYGQKKKFLIAFGLASMATYLILDEPTNGLDIPSKGDFRKIIAKYMSADQVVIISTHQIKDLENLLDAITIIDEGKILLSESLMAIEDKIYFTTDTTLPNDTSTLHHERIPGGYLILSQNIDGMTSQIEIEAFFNAVIRNKSYFSQLFNS